MTSSPPIVWRPDAALLHDSNVARFMTAEGIPDFDTLVERSIDEPEWFWPAAIRFLGIRFDGSITPACDTTAGVPWATWFTGATTNVARACVDEFPATDVAIIWEGEAGTTRTLTGADLRALTDRIANGLRARGVE